MAVRRGGAAPGGAGSPSPGRGDGRSRSWLLAYDVVDDRCRRRVAARLEAAGHRVQYSVFGLHLPAAAATAALDDVAALGGADDAFLLLRSCGRCRPVEVGRPVEDDRPRAVVW